MFYPFLDRLVAKGRITIEDDRIMSRAEFEAKQREALERERRLPCFTGERSISDGGI